MESLESNNNQWHLPPGYRSNEHPTYFEDEQTNETVWQEAVYGLAAETGQLFRARIALDIGCGNGDKTLGLSSGFRTLALDTGSNLQLATARHADAYCLVDLDLLHSDALERFSAYLEKFEVGSDPGLAVCADVIEHLPDPTNLLKVLGCCQTLGFCIVVSTPDRRIVRGPDDLGPPANPAHVREWAAEEFLKVLEAHGLNVILSTHLSESNFRSRKGTHACVCTEYRLDRSANDTLLVTMTSGNVATDLRALVCNAWLAGRIVHITDKPLSLPSEFPAVEVVHAPHDELFRQADRVFARAREPWRAYLRAAEVVRQSPLNLATGVFQVADSGALIETRVWQRNSEFSVGPRIDEHGGVPKIAAPPRSAAVGHIDLVSP